MARPVEYLSEGRVVFLVEEAHLLTAEIVDSIADHWKHPSWPQTTTILTTNEVDRVPVRARAIFDELPVAPLGFEDRLRLLEQVSTRAHLQVDEAALALIVERVDHVWTLLRHLERIAARGPVTLERTREHFELDRVHPLGHYFAAVCEDGLLAQIAALEAWRDTPEVKAKALEAFFAGVLSNDILGLAHADRALDVVPEVRRRALVKALEDTCRELELPSRTLWQEWARHWRIDSEPTAATLLRKAIEFDSLINARREIPAEVEVKLARAEIARPRFGRPRRRQEDGTHGSTDQHYLTKEQVQDIWERASFLVQRFGVLLNTRITLRYAAIGISDQREASQLMTDMKHDLRQRLDKLAWGTIQSNEGEAERLIQVPDGLHSLFVHENRPGVGLVTHIVAHVPVGAECFDIADWIRTTFLPLKLDRSCPHEAVTVRRKDAVLAVSKASAGKITNAARMRQHWDLIRVLCRGLDPAVTVPVVVGRGQRGQVKLAQLLSIDPRLADELGPLEVGRYGSSRRIAAKAQREARSEGFPPHSAFKAGAWHQLEQGWELDEFAWRMGHERQRRQTEAEILRKWPAGTGKAQDRRREVELTKLRESWLDEAEKRRRDRWERAGASARSPSE